MRRFNFTSIQQTDFGPRQRAAEIVCSACGEKDHIVCAGYSSLPDDVLTKRFQKGGWQIASNPNADLCPVCVAKKAAPKPKLQLVKVPVMAAPEPVVAPLPSPELKRRINAKLFEVYEGDAHGYAVGWSDKRVAEDLKAPKALVAEIREQFFGPVKDNAEVRELLDRCEAIFEEAGAIEKKATDLLAEVKNLSSRVAGLKRDADAIRKAVA